MTTTSVDAKPAIRARWTQMLLEGLDVRLSDVELSCVRPRLEPARLAYIRRLDPLEWLDIETHIHVLDALYWGLGKPRYVAYYRETARRILHSRLLKTVAVAGARVFGRAALVRAFPRGWNLVIRDCGILEVARDDARGITEIVLREMPPVVARSEAIRLATASSIAAAIDIAGYLGKVKVDPGPVRDRTFVFRISLVVEPPTP
ncbi:hypothetical protein [Paraliomyxa miuraensis]|uniref:hypothetical protein n=1 Tax=Paraliomyxa miuraensis TaxID=376150 RepID=UPI0022566090|nr:hypothetical protein [Paraliomyxa miuraensis]MCX4247983.1 hypothetical protein [Paraliomyxa miuraensis]